MQNWQRLTSRMCFRPLPKLICMVESRTCMELWLVIWSKMIFHKGIGFHMILSHTRQKNEKKKEKRKTLITSMKMKCHPRFSIIKRTIFNGGRWSSQSVSILPDEFKLHCTKCLKAQSKVIERRYEFHWGRQCCEGFSGRSVSLKFALFTSIVSCLQVRGMIFQSPWHPPVNAVLLRQG